MVRPGRFERPTYRFVVTCCLNQLNGLRRMMASRGAPGVPPAVPLSRRLICLFESMDVYATGGFCCLRMACSTGQPGSAGPQRRNVAG
jgi:hypothetical protein